MHLVGAWENERFTADKLQCVMQWYLSFLNLVSPSKEICKHRSVGRFDMNVQFDRWHSIVMEVKAGRALRKKSRNETGIQQAHRLV